jgi:hypothetical protein
MNGPGTTHLAERGTALSGEVSDQIGEADRRA